MVCAVDMADYEQQGLLHEMFSRQAKATPDKVSSVTFVPGKLPKILF